jgi:vacuolar-type H+-ATPase subunit H
MSEFQFYEFQAIDRPLNYEDQKYVQSLSSRVKLTATNAQFLYNYGDFRGQPEKLLDRCFDIFVYVANFGVRQLMIRFPKGAIDAKIFAPYCVDNNIEVMTTDKSIILDICINQEAYYGWLEETTYATSLLALREEILRGDLRLLYLAWLSSGFAEDPEGEPEDLIEPPVPANLQKLSPALQAFAELFQIDADLITAAAIESPTAQAQTEPIADWIAALSESERSAYLLRVAQGETQVGAELMQHLRKKFGKSSKVKLKSPGRSLAELIELAEETHTQRTNKAKKAAATARQKYLKTIAPKADEIWQAVYQLIELKQAKPYDEAVAKLVDLQDLAISQDNLPQFNDRITTMKQQYSSRSGLITRLQKAGLLILK